MEDPSSSMFEDQYHQVKKERDLMASQLNDLDDANRILRTKCAQLQTFKKKVVKGSMDAGQLASSLIDTIGKPAKLQQDYEDLFKSYEMLQRDYRAVVTKYKSSSQVIRKLKKEIQSLKLRGYGGRTNNYRTNSSRTQTGGCRKALNANRQDAEAPEVDKENVDENVLGQLQIRLSSAETQLRTLRSTPLKSGAGIPEVRCEMRTRFTFCRTIFSNSSLQY